MEPCDAMLRYYTLSPILYYYILLLYSTIVFYYYILLWYSTTILSCHTLLPYSPLLSTTTILDYAISPSPLWIYTLSLSLYNKVKRYLGVHHDTTNTTTRLNRALLHLPTSFLSSDPPPLPCPALPCPALIYPWLVEKLYGVQDSFSFARCIVSYLIDTLTIHRIIPMESAQAQAQARFSSQVSRESPLFTSSSSSSSSSFGTIELCTGRCVLVSKQAAINGHQPHAARSVHSFIKGDGWTEWWMDGNQYIDDLIGRTFFPNTVPTDIWCIITTPLGTNIYCVAFDHNA